MAHSQSIQLDDLGALPKWTPPVREVDDNWTVSSHYFASYAKRRSNALMGSSTTDPGNLAVVANRYEPKSLQHQSKEATSLTLILALACGLHKETWEPMITALIGLMQSDNSKYSIREIWAVEPVHHGDAAMLNRDANLLVDSMNYPVDLIELIERRLPLETPTAGAALPVHLPRHEVSRRPNVIGVGHSIGGAAVVHAALHSPKSFAGLVLIEPLVTNPLTNIHRPYQLVAEATLKRKDKFTSRDDLVQHFSKHPIYKAWAPEVIRLFSIHGTYEMQDGSICLKTSKAHEAKLASDREHYQAVWYAMRSFSAHTPVFFIYASKSRLIRPTSQVETPTQPTKSQSVMVDTGHLVVQERPDLVAHWMNTAFRSGFFAPPHTFQSPYPSSYPKL